ncbi:triphosphoribosyl-dephospho-CoA synthase [Halomarina litorea]|uniref:triphosphoribosyl-dephospho-CoA synthase n=1 Tax=Halomarina litorea TaxID=2961595 RepID=UPI0020C5360B|nr:triphosphoribosyl-dephospho-CoA synthase [Halomarina sp. BCD28]
MSRRSHAQHAELALLLEVTGTPKPGNVDRQRDHDDLRFEHFVAGAVGSAPGLRLAAGNASLGLAFERGVFGMADQTAGNTQFGALLLLVPLVRAASRGSLDREGVERVVESTTVADACEFYRAFEHVDVAVSDPPGDLAALDVRRGSEAIPALRGRGLTLSDLMAESREVDGVAEEWAAGFPRTFEAAEWILDDERPVPDRAARAFLRLLADRPDTFVEKQRDAATAREATERARAALAGETDPEELAEAFVAEGVNPGTTADLIAAALYVALERGLAV